VRKAAVEALSGLEDPAALPALRKLLHDANAEVREAVADAVAGLSESDE